MGRWLRLGLTDKLFIPFVCILLLTVAATATLTISMLADRDADRTTQFTARLKAQWRSVAQPLWKEGELEKLSALLRDAVETDSLLNSVTLYNGRGAAIASSQQGGTSGSGYRLETPVIGPDGEHGRLVANYAARLAERTSLELIATIILTGLGTIVIGAFVYMKVLNVVILRRIKAASDAAAAIAGRDLGLRLDDRGEDELALLAGAFNRMTETLQEVIGGIQSVVLDIDARAAGIMNSVGEQFRISNVQSEEATRISGVVREMADQTRRIANSSHEVVRIADDTHKSSDRGVAATDEARSVMDQIASGAAERGEQISELKRRAEQIGDVMEFIEQIADQTKLIAFNASIEAAGAGEMGRRFEVVAREIRRLAENVSESASQIRTRIVDIQQAIDRLASTSIEESRKVRLGSESALNTVTALHNIREFSNKTNLRIQEISEAISHQDSSAGELVVSIKGVDENALKLKEGLDSLVGIASNLKQLSGALRELSAGFALSGRS